MAFDLNLAFYIRLSSEDLDLKNSEKAESNSVTNQRKLLHDYYREHLELKKYNIIEFCDDGFTGTSFERPRFTDMMQLVRQRKINAILVKDLSRFGRDYLEVGAYLELILPLFGTRFISVNDRFDSDDYIGTTGGIELALRNLINGMYSKDLSVKIRSANQTRNRRGEYWGGSAFYGYTVGPGNKHKLLVDKNVDHIVKRIYHECISGRTAAQIAKQLNDEGVISPAKYKHNQGALYNGRTVDKNPIWTATTVLRILKDERYTGKMITGKRESVGINTGKMRAVPKEQWIVVEGTHEAIISQQLFDSAAAAREGRIKTVNRNTAGNRANNLFVCGHCGRKLQKSSGHVKYLFCLKAGVLADSPCKRIREPIDDLHDHVLKTVNTLAQVLVERIEKMVPENEREMLDIENNMKTVNLQIRRLNGGKLDLYEDYRQEKISRNKFLSIQKRRQQESDQLNERLLQLQQQLEALKSKAKQMEQLADHSRENLLLTTYQPEVIRQLVKQVRVYGENRIEIDLLSNDDFITDILDSILQNVG